LARIFDWPLRRQYIVGYFSIRNKSRGVKMTTKFRVYASMAYSPLHTETSSNAVQYTVPGGDCFEALGNANAAARKIGIDLKAFKYFEITKVDTNE
jgi:hypothetical protein